MKREPIYLTVIMLITFLLLLLISGSLLVRIISAPIVVYSMFRVLIRVGSLDEDELRMDSFCVSLTLLRAWDLIQLRVLWMINRDQYRHFMESPRLIYTEEAILIDGYRTTRNLDLYCLETNLDKIAELLYANQKIDAHTYHKMIRCGLKPNDQMLHDYVQLQDDVWETVN